LLMLIAHTVSSPGYASKSIVGFGESKTRKEKFMCIAVIVKDYIKTSTLKHAGTVKHESYYHCNLKYEKERGTGKTFNHDSFSCSNEYHPWSYYRTW